MDKTVINEMLYLYFIKIQLDCSNNQIIYFKSMGIILMAS